MDQALCIWDPRVNWLLFIVAAISGVVFLYGLKMGWSTFRLRLFGRRTRGKIIVVSRREGDESGLKCRLWIRFASEAGKSVTFADNGLGNSDYDVGDDIPVVYDPRNPSRAQSELTVHHFVTPVFYVLLAVSVVWALTQLDCSPSWSSGRNSAKCDSGWLGATGCGPPP